MLRIKYTTYEFGGLDIHLRTLRNSQEFEDGDNSALKMGIYAGTWSLFGVLWPAGEVLAHLMSLKDTKDLKILEVGCGVALPSHVLNSKGANIVATDWHPLANQFLDKNSLLNDKIKIPYFSCDWAQENLELGKFDLIIGSDLLYQQDHSSLLAKFINDHANDKCEVIIVDPGRGNLSKFKKEMTQYNFTHAVSRFLNEEKMSKDFTGQIITFLRNN